MAGTWILGKGEFVKQLIQQSDEGRKVQFSALGKTGGVSLIV
jgi:hypothetical protein